MSCFKQICLLCIFFFSSLYLYAEETQSYKVSETQTFVYKKPEFLGIFTNGLKDFPGVYNAYFDKEHVPYFLGIAASTAISIYYDEDLLIGAQKLGRQWNIASEDHTKTFFEVFGFNVRFPTDLGSSMYFIGDGWTHSSIAVGFWGYGYFANDYRAWSTGYALLEGLWTTGVTTQFLKHITGRESPVVRTRDRGRWDFFPDQRKYHKDVPAYDAFPSGHLATGTMTLTIIAENYPEYIWIKPVGISLLTMLSYQMMNNGVHWFSDYPLAIGIGYAFGQVAVNNYRKIENAHAKAKTQRNYESVYLFNPLISSRSLGLSMTVLL